MSAHGHPWGDEPLCVDIGPDVCLTPIRSAEGATHEEGYWFCHDVPGSDHRCTGRVLTRAAEGRPVWTQTGTLEGGDLTLSPSVLCRYPAGENSHEYHGWVRDGQWVSA